MYEMKKTGVGEIANPRAAKNAPALPADIHAQKIPRDAKAL
jgi:hypothetical protein